MKTKNNKEKFFFAEFKSGMYDDTIEMVCPDYKNAHQLFITLFNTYINNPEFNGNVLDIGAGTGEESIKILELYKNIKIVAVDLCAPMRKQFESKIKSINLLHQVNYVIGDFLDISVEELKTFTEQKIPFNVVISAYTLHHFTADEKKRALKKIYDLLQPGGLFLNLDLFNYRSDTLSEIAHKYDIEFINSNFNKYPNLRELGELWTKHYNEDNILHPADEQLEELQKIGFTQTGIPYKNMQNGIVWAIK